MKRFCLLLFVSALFLSSSGCQPANRPEGLPTLHPCTVTVTQNGAPVADVSVQLIAKEASNWPSGGITDAAGKAVIVTYGRFPGVPLGEYTVVLSKQESKSDPSADEYTSGTTEIFSLIAVEHTKQETSALRLTVNKGKNAESFEVGAPVRVLVDTIQPGT